MTKEELENIAKDRFKEKPIGYESNFELKIYQDGFAEGYEYCQASTVRTDNTETLENALNRIAELESQVEKM